MPVDPHTVESPAASRSSAGAGRWPVLRRIADRTLVAVTTFSALSAVGGGLGLIVTDGLGMPHSFLDGGPFSSYLWPGIILLLVVGGTQVLSLALLLRQAPTRLLASAVAGFGMTIWIVVEVGLINEFSWPHMIYLGAGVLQLAAVLGVLGIVPERQSSPN